MPGRLRQPMALRRSPERVHAPAVSARPRPAISTDAWIVAVALAVVMLAAFHLVQVRHAAVRLGYSLSQATREREQLLEEQRKLRLEVATLKDPTRLRALARSLGLVEPDPARVLFLGRGSGRLALDAGREP